MKKIGIRFSDNDFRNTIMAFMEGLKVQPWQKVTYTKEQVAELFNRSAAGLYWLHQNRLQYNLQWDASSYLKIEPKHVYFDKEVDAHIEKNNGWDNGEFFVIDFQQHNGPYIYSI